MLTLEKIPSSKNSVRSQKCQKTVMKRKQHLLMFCFLPVLSCLAVKMSRISPLKGKQILLNHRTFLLVGAMRKKRRK